MGFLRDWLLGGLRFIFVFEVRYVVQDDGVGLLLHFPAIPFFDFIE